MYVLVVGTGKVGQQLVYTLTGQGHDVAVVETRSEVCERLAHRTPARVVCGNGTDVAVLARAGAERADVLVAATGFDEENLVVCKLAQEFFEVPRIIARVNSPTNERVFRELGIPEVISVTTLIAHLVEETATVGELLQVHYVGKGRAEIVEVELPPRSKLVGRDVATVAATLPPDSLLISLVRGDDVIIPRGDTVFEAGDRVLAVVKVGQEPPLRRALLA